MRNLGNNYKIFLIRFPQNDYKISPSKFSGTQVGPWKKKKTKKVKLFNNLEDSACFVSYLERGNAY